MKVRPYLIFKGNCQDAIVLYERAFQSKASALQRYSDMPLSPGMSIPDEFANQILQCTLPVGDNYIRLSDCGPGGTLNDPDSQRITLAVEASVDQVKHAFYILAEAGGDIHIPLAETFYSPCAGLVVDKFGVTWNFIAQ